jgi:hypothetical protein
MQNTEWKVGEFLSKDYMYSQSRSRPTSFAQWLRTNSYFFYRTLLPTFLAESEYKAPVP